MSTLFSLPVQIPLTTSAGLYPGALAYFYVTETSTPKTVYSDADLVTPHSNPVEADENGQFPPIWLDTDEQYRVTVKTAGGDTLEGYPVDGVGGPAMSQADLGLTLFPQTDEENAAGVTPADYSKLPGYETRYTTFSHAVSQSDHGGAPVVSANGGIRLVGSLDPAASGATERDEAQLLMKNTVDSGHTIMTQVNVVAGEECAWEAVGYLDNSVVQQKGAAFWRWSNGDNGALTFKAAFGLHLTEYNADNCPFIAYSNNSLLLCGGSTTGEKWATQSEADTVDIYAKGKARSSFTIGSNHSATCATGFRLEVEDYAQFGTTGANAITKALRVGYDTGADTAFVESYDNANTVYKDITVRGTTVILAGGDTRPGTNNAYKLGTASYRFTEVFATNGTINTSDERLKDFEAFTDAHRELAKAIKSSLRPFRWKDSPDKVHYGASAQRVYSLCLDYGVDPLQQGFLQHDPESDTWGINYAELAIFILGAL